MSTSIIIYLEVTRTIVAEATNALSDNWEDKQNSLDSIGASRHKTAHEGRAYHAKCPKMYCYARGAFYHMLDCYKKRKRAQRGPEAVSFLAEMAKVAGRPKGKAPKPFYGILAPGTRKRDAALRNEGNKDPNGTAGRERASRGVKWMVTRGV